MKEEIIINKLKSEYEIKTKLLWTIIKLTLSTIISLFLSTSITEVYSSRMYVLFITLLIIVIR